MTKEALKLALEALENNRQAHHYCEDTWYSCPKHEDGCANDAEGDECNCGADKANAEIDAAITAIKESLAQPEPEYLAFMDTPQRPWVCLTDGEVDKMILLMGFPPDWITENAIVKNIVRNLEAKLKDKNNV